MCEPRIEKEKRDTDTQIPQIMVDPELAPHACGDGSGSKKRTGRAPTEPLALGHTACPDLTLYPLRDPDVTVASVLFTELETQCHKRLSLSQDSDLLLSVACVSHTKCMGR
jgi:hypothetical protein